MTNILFAASLLTSTFAIADYKIVDVKHSEIFAGKLGRESKDQLTLEKDGKKFQVNLNSTYSNFAGKVRTFKVGETVHLNKPLTKSTSKVYRENIK